MLDRESTGDSSGSQFDGDGDDHSFKEGGIKSKKRKYDSDDSKRRLVRAAIDIFSKEGFDAATTRGIAKKAGVNDSLIHRYFENKLGLFFAILRDYHAQITASPPYPPGNTVEEELASFFKFRIEFSRKKRKLLKLGITRSILDPKVRKEMDALVRNGMPGLLARLEKLQGEGKIRTDVNLDLVCMLLGGITFSMSMFTGIIFHLDESLADGVLSEATKIIADGLAPKKL
jgi:TetR/AcrR family transcriptional regulator, regulator of cefoperazone and chloramphenicol sensitivity